MYNKFKYYGNYDKNIKSIKGGGVITPSNPPNKMSTTYSIKNIWNDEIIPTPPLYKSTYYSNKNLTDGYLNEDNYVVENKPISDYYYPSQKFNKVINIKDSNGDNKIKKEILNDLNPIQFPPPLINSKYSKNKYIKIVKHNKSDKPNNYDKTNNSDKPINSDKTNNSDKSDKINEIENNKYIDYIANNTIYDGKYIYMIEDKPIDFNNENKKYKVIQLPYLSYNNSNKEQNVNNNIYNNINDNIYENFEDNNNSNNVQISNTLLLIILSIILIIYFTIYQK